MLGAFQIRKGHTPMSDFSLSPIQLEAATSLQGIAERYMANFPDLHTLARLAAGHIVRKQLGYWMDPDRIYWHRFRDAASSDRTFTGWLHQGVPLRSMTLTELTLRRFTLDEQANSDLLSLYGGFYRVDAAHGWYNETTEVRLLPIKVQQAFWSLDFQPVYLRALEKFWQVYAEDFCLLARAAYLSSVAWVWTQKEINQEDREALLKALGPGVAFPMSLQQLKARYPSELVSPFHECQLDSYTAREMLWMALPGGRQALFIYGQRRCEIQIFADRAALDAWVRGQLQEASGRDRFISHFLGNATARSDHGPALHALCDQLNAGTLSLEHAAHGLSGDGFEYLSRYAMLDMQLDAAARTTSNSALRKARWMNYLNVATGIVSPAALLWWPLTSVAIGLSAGSLVLHVDQALEASTQAQRRAAWAAAFVDVLFILIDSQMLRVGETFEAPALVDAPALATGQSYVPGSLRALQDTAQTPPALYEDEVGLAGRTSSFWDVHMQASADELLAVSDLALARQRALLVHVPRVDLQALTVGGDYLDAFGQPYRVYRDELGYGARNIKQYSHSPQQYNNLLRDLALEDEPARNVARIHSLAEELEMLGGDNQVRLYRVGAAGRETAGAYWREGRVKVGDRMLSTDFTSFSENPFVAWEVFNSPVAQVSGRAIFDDNAVVYVLEPGGAACAVPVAPFSDLPHEAESVLLPGWYLQVEDIVEVSGEHYRFIQVRLRALEPGEGEGAVYELRTGQPFLREMHADRLGSAGASLLERFFPQF